MRVLVTNHLAPIFNMHNHLIHIYSYISVWYAFFQHNWRYVHNNHHFVTQFNLRNTLLHVLNLQHLWHLRARLSLIMKPIVHVLHYLLSEMCITIQPFISTCWWTMSVCLSPLNNMHWYILYSAHVSKIHKYHLACQGHMINLVPFFK